MLLLNVQVHTQCFPFVHQVIDVSGAWAAGTSIVVQTGDVVDRGPDGINATMMLSKLQV